MTPGPDPGPLPVIYLHGFSSAAASAKAARLRALLAPPFHIADYPSHRPLAAIAQLRDSIARMTAAQRGAGRVLLVGSSLGGFYAQYLGATLDTIAGVVLINPALQPQRTLQPFVGENINMVTGERFLFSAQDLQDLAQYDIGPDGAVAPTLVLLDAADELIDSRVAARRYRHRGRVVVYPGGSHRFEHIEAAAREIAGFRSA